MINPRDALHISFEVAISLLVVLFIVAWCFQLLMPFIGLITWGTVIAVSLYGPYCGLRERVGGKLATVIFGVVGVSVILVPAWLFAGSIIGPLQTFAANVEAGTFQIAPPAESVKDWPLIGEKTFATWSQAAHDMGAFLSDHSHQLRDLATLGLTKAAGLGITVLMFLASTVIAVALLANDSNVIKGMRLFFTRLVGHEQGAEAMTLTTNTIRSVTVGVLGIAFIQSVLGGLGMVVVGVPAAGIWAVAILILAIAQLPPLLVLLPVVIYVFSVESTTVATIFAVWSFIVAFGDAVLKPLLLGRGVDVPTLVILLGAIGGMITMGILGLFVGAVVLALGYKLLVTWLAMTTEHEAADAASAAEE